MDDLPVRLKLVRELFSKSARQFSLELGLSPGAWNGYETGAYQPGTPVYFALAERGINLNWLLTGMGPIKTQQDVGEDVPSLASAAEHALGLGRMGLLAASSNVKIRTAILDCLVTRYPKPLTLAEITELVKESKLNVASELVFLQESGHVMAEGLKPQLYRANNLVVGLNIGASIDRARVIVDAVSFLLSDALRNTDSDKGILFDGVAHVADGKAYLQSLFELAKHKGVTEHAYNADKVRIVIGASVITPDLEVTE